MAFKDLWLKKNEDVPETPVQAPKTNQPIQSKKDGYVFSPNPSSTTNTTITPTTGVPDDKFISMLEAVISDNNLPGLDYYEFKKAIDKMSNLPMDEKTKFLSTYSIYESQGATKEILLSSIDTYIGLINKEQESFDAEMAAQYKEKVENRKLEIEKNQKEIVELNNKIIELNNANMTASQESQQEDMKLKMTDANFKQSINTVISTLKSDKEKLTNYIK